MKKTIFSLMAFTAFSSAIYAQTPDIKIGAKAGVNFANVTDGDMKTGFHVGGLVEIFINEKFSVQPELLYSTQGAKANNKISELKLDYINVPIMAKYYVMEGLSVQAGPQVAFLMKAESEISSVGGIPVTGTFDIKDSLNTVDFGVNFGAGYELPMGVFAEARYNLGLTKLPKEGGDYKNSVIQISVGYKF
ncbi:porin family protein [Flavobacterium sp. NKUCC04_CG]|uniref:porin family protein n=1 Tax=Flavobacterium sp. NKUCC04_CG TaxID=2842121 RepID=UPI001C5A80C9|nr:porin family protein [Flavobacterium sp. NKUCC04_CG]MBW3519424.1 PorT family protein [Flavobacterium sp. NKUCC04_CG]